MLLGTKRDLGCGSGTWSRLFVCSITFSSQGNRESVPYVVPTPSEEANESTSLGIPMVRLSVHVSGIPRENPLEEMSRKSKIMIRETLAGISVSVFIVKWSIEPWGIGSLHYLVRVFN